tara:strand:+ start:4970 stop:5614 length:645 start_codon:yes stop_codon:yes gene_type:complete
MTLKWNEGEPRADNIVDAGQINKSYDSYKAAINGNLGRDNLPHNVIDNTHTTSNAFHSISLTENIKIPAGDKTWVNSGTDLGPGGWTADKYEGGWYRLHKTSALQMQEGILHIELMGFGCYNLYKTQQAAGGEQRDRPYGLEFKIHVNGAEIVRSPLYCYTIQPVHVVVDVPIAGGEKTIEVFWRIDATAPSNTSDLWQVYFGGLQLFLMNRYR